MSDPIRQPITPVSVIATILALGFLAACGSAQLLQSSEAARRTRCTSQLTQLALAVHNYHDVHNQLPPLATNDKHWTWVTECLPFLDKAEAFDDLTLYEPATMDQNQKVKVVKRFRMKELLCPARRSKAVRKEGPFKGGQPSDYVAVSTTDFRKLSTKTKWHDYLSRRGTDEATSPIAIGHDIRTGHRRSE